MSFLDIQVNDFVATLYNIFVMVTIPILFGMAINIEHYRDQMFHRKQRRLLNEGLKNLKDCEL